MDDRPTLLEHARSLVTGGHDPSDATAFAGLPDDLVTEAMTLVADALPAPVAAHLSPFTMANSPFADPSDVVPRTGLDALETLSRMPPIDLDDLDHPPPLVGLTGAAATTVAAEIDKSSLPGSDPDPVDVSFGAGEVKTDAVHDYEHEQREAAPDLDDDGYLAPADQRFEIPEPELKLDRGDYEPVEEPDPDPDWDIDFD